MDWAATLELDPQLETPGPLPVMGEPRNSWLPRLWGSGTLGKLTPLGDRARSGSGQLRELLGWELVSSEEKCGRGALHIDEESELASFLRDAMDLGLAARPTLAVRVWVFSERGELSALTDGSPRGSAHRFPFGD